MDFDDIMNKVLQHEYDPVKAHEYYLRVRKLKGKGTAAEVAGAKEYEKRVVGDAQKQLTSDLKKTPVKMNKKRKVGAAEQKLIRAKSLASRVKDPSVRSDMLKRLSSAEKKLGKVKARISGKKFRIGGVQSSAYDKKPRNKQRLEEDQVPMKSKRGAKLRKFDGKAQKATYNDGSVYGPDGWVKGEVRKATKPKRETVTYKDGSTVTYEGDTEVGTTPPKKRSS